MRESCFECILKHLSQATILMTEAELGYPWHKWYAIGHMAEAESEAIMRFPEVAVRIREFRKAYSEGRIVDMDVLVDYVAKLYDNYKKEQKSKTEQKTLDDFGGDSTV